MFHRKDHNLLLINQTHNTALMPVARALARLHTPMLASMLTVPNHYRLTLLSAHLAPKNVPQQRRQFITHVVPP